MRSKKILIFLILISTKSLYADSFKSEDYNIQAEIISDQLEHPWSLVFLPSQDILISERTGNLRKVTKAGFLQKQPIQGLPDIKQNGQGGLLDLAIHPLFKENRLLYFSFSEETEQGLGTAVAYGTLEKNKIKNVKVIFRLTPKSNTNYHFGSRLIFDKDNFLYITLGDRGSRPRAQNLNDHAGSIIRIYDDASIPEAIVLSEY